MSKPNNTWAERYRALLRAESRRKVMDNVVPRTQEILDNYVRGRRGELKFTSIRWGNVALAFGLAGLLLTAIYCIHKVFA